jgi:hypothetical protein
METIDMKKVSDYARHLVKVFCNFLKETGLSASLYDIDVVILFATVKRYLQDVERLHQHHGIDFIDCHKIAGYLAYWICRLKPVHVKDESVAYEGNMGDTDLVGIAKQSFFINELFSVFLGLSRIDSHYKASNINKRIVLDKNFINTLTYSLKYRLVTGDMLSLTYYMIDTACSKEVQSATTATNP